MALGMPKILGKIKKCLIFIWALKENKPKKLDHLIINFRVQWVPLFADSPMSGAPQVLQ